MKKLALLLCGVTLLAVNTFAQTSAQREPKNLPQRLQKASTALKSTASNNILNGNMETWVADSIETASGNKVMFSRPDMWAPINGIFIAYFLDLGIPISASLNGTNTSAKIEIADMDFGSDLATIVIPQTRPLSLSGEYQFTGASVGTAFFDVYATKFNPAADSSEVVGAGFFKVDQNTTGTFQNFTASIDYINGTVVPDTVYVFASYLQGDMGTWLKFDNLSLSYTATGVQNSKYNDLKIYPNPSSDVIRLQLANNESIEDAKVEVRSLDGRVQLSIDNYQSNSTIDLSTLPAGLYIINVQNESGVRSQKIQKI